MDTNSTGHERPPTIEPPQPASTAQPAPTAQPLRPPQPRGSRSVRLRSALDRRAAAAMAAIAALAVLALIAGIVVAGGGVFGGPTGSPTPNPSHVAAVSPTASAHPTSTSTPTPAPPSAKPAPTQTPLPALLGAIGDSYSQAYSVSPAYRYDHPQFSWVVGTDKNDGVFSLLERFQTLGATPTVVDAATSGKKMNDAPRQANLVVAAAKKLKTGQTAYVTFELGTNDLCDDPKTDPADFGLQLHTALGTLVAGLPPGSRILMLALPDFPHFHDMTQADPTTRAALLLTQNSNRCSPYLGTAGPSTVAEADYYLSQYDAILKSACNDIDAGGGAVQRLHCTYDVALLAESDFTATDLSTADYFHPSLSGQGKMAQDAWKADAWAATPVSSRPSSGDIAANVSAAAGAVGFALPIAWMRARGARRAWV